MSPTVSARPSPLGAMRRSALVPWLLWLVAFAGTGYLAFRRYHALTDVVPTGPSGAGGDFWLFVNGARHIAAGRSLYDPAAIPKGYDGYVYTPLIAIVLLPFAHAATVLVWHAWTALSIAALVLFCGLVTLVEARPLSSWKRPVLFGVTVVSALQFVATKIELSQGQVDVYVLVLFAGMVLVSERGWAATSGTLVGVAGLIKTWPAAAALAMFRRGITRRRRALAALVFTLALGPLLAAAVGGASEVTAFFTTTFASRSQHLISHSVWGTPLLLFSRSGLAHPVLVSAPLRDVATAALAAWTIGLLVLTVHWSDSSVLGFWNVVGCVVLLLPVSHSAYTLFFLPLLWIWVARWLAVSRFRGLLSVVTGLLVLWWAVLFHTDWSPIATGSPTESSLRISVIFFANLAAVTVSVFGDHLLRGPVVSPQRARTASKARRHESHTASGTGGRTQEDESLGATTVG